MSTLDALRLYVQQSDEGLTSNVTDLADAVGMDPLELNSFFRMPSVVRRLRDQYNLPPPPLKGSRKSLTPQQRKWITYCTNPHTAKGIPTLAIEFGIDMATHRRWMRQSAFREAYNTALQREVVATEGEIFRKATNRAATGDPKAIEILYRMMGKPLQQASVGSAATSISLADLVPILQQVCTQDQLALIAGAITTRELNPGDPQSE